MIDFVITFLLTLPFSWGLDYLSHLIIKNKILAFTLYHLLLVPFLFNDNYANFIVWFILTYLHGMAHILHPPFIGKIPNTNYTALYDYIVHDAQCLCIFYYQPQLFPIGIFASSMMLMGAVMTHINKKFFEEPFWLFASGFGTFGSHYHMMLLNTHKNENIFYGSCIIWISPFLPYLIRQNIPTWDYLMNTIGLFRAWYFNFFVAYYFYTLDNPKFSFII